MAIRLLIILLSLLVKVVILQSPILKEFYSNSNGVGLGVCVSNGLVYVSHWFSAIRVWNITSGDPVATIPMSAIPFDLACNNDYLIVADKFDIKIRKLDGSSTIQAGRSSSGEYTSVILAGNIIIALKVDTWTNLGEISTHTLLNGTLLNYVDKINTTSTILEYNNMAVGSLSLFVSFGNDILEYDLQTLAYKKIFYRSSKLLRAVVYCNILNVLVVGVESYVEIFDVTNGQKIMSFNSNTALASIACFEGLLFVGSNDGKIHKYDMIGTLMQTYSCRNNDARVLKTRIFNTPLGLRLFTAEFASGNTGGSTMFDPKIAMIISIQPDRDIVPYEQSIIHINIFAPANSLNIAQTPSISVGMQPCTNVSWVNVSMLSCNLPVVQGNPAQVQVDLTNSGLPIVLTSNIYFKHPRIVSISPNTTNCTTFSTMTLQVDNLADPTRDPPVVTIGNEICTNSLQQGNNTITCQIPWGQKPGQVFVIVKVKGINSTINETIFTYLDPMVTSLSSIATSFSPLGGDNIDISGYNFGVCSGCNYNQLSVMIGNSSCANPIVKSDTLITCVTTPGFMAKIDVVVSIENIKSLTSNAFFSYAPPIVLSADPPKYDGVVGTLITISGSNFGPAIDNDISVELVRISNSTAGSILVCDNLMMTVRNTRLSCTLPSGIGGYRYRIKVVHGNQESSQSVIYQNYYSVQNPVVPEHLTFNCFQDDGSSKYSTFIILISETDDMTTSYQLKIEPKNGILYRVDSNNKKGQAVSTYPFTIPNKNNTLIYVPNRFFVGSDNFTYSAIDGTLSSNDCIVTVNVIKTNQAPYVNSQHVGLSFKENSIDNVITLTCDDFENDPLQYIIVSLPLQGNLSDGLNAIQTVPFPLSSNQIRYNPIPFTFGVNYSAITWTCKDSNGSSLNLVPGAQIQINVDEIDIPPVAISSNSIMNENSELIVSLKYFDAHNYNCSLTVIMIPKNGALYQFQSPSVYTTPIISGTKVNDISGRILYVPNKDFFGVDYFTYEAVNTKGVKSLEPGKVDINIAMVNKGPSLFQQMQDETYNGQSKKIVISAYDREDQINIHLIIKSLPESGKLTLENDQVIKIGQNITMSKDSNGFSAAITFTDSNTGGWYPSYNFTYRVHDSDGVYINETGIVRISVKCNDGLSNSIWTNQGSPCTDCLVGAICYPGGEEFPTNKLGYYPYLNENDNTVQFIPCSVAEACPRGALKTTLKSLSNYTFTCGEGYTGDRCGQCVSDHSTNTIFYRKDLQCIACPADKISPVSLVAIAGSLLLGLLLLIGIIRKIDFGFISILINFWQTISIFSSFNLKWPQQILSFYHYFSFFNLNIEIAAPECYVIPDNSKSYEYKWYTTILVPIALICLIYIIVLIYMILYKIYKFIKSLFPKNTIIDAGTVDRNIRNSATLNTDKELDPEKLEESEINDMKKSISHLLFPISLFSNYLLYLKFMYLSLSLKVTELFNCDFIGGNYFFEAEPNRYCYESWWFNMLPFDIAGLLFYVLGIPSFMIYLYLQKQYITKNIPLRSRTTFHKAILILTFKPNNEFKNGFEIWETYLAVRKLIIVLVQLFFSRYPIFQAQVLSVFFILAIYLQGNIRPYVTKSLNYLEESTLLASTVILLSGVLFKIQEFENETQKLFLAYVVITVIGASSLGVLITMMIHFRYRMKNSNFKKILEIL